MNDFTNVAEVELVYRTKVKPSDRIKISMSSESAKIFYSIFDYNTIEHKESFWAMYLNRANKILGVLLISTGGTSGTVADPKLIFQGALKLNACGIIVCHNHPSGNMKPSDQDISLSRKLRDGAKLLEMQLLDSIIISSEDIYFSLADEGLL